MWICTLRWWDARLDRSSGVWGVSPQMDDIDHTRLISPGHRKGRAGSVESVRAMGLLW